MYEWVRFKPETQGGRAAQDLQRRMAGMSGKGWQSHLHAGRAMSGT
jgi:hypothetical protein